MEQTAKWEPLILQGNLGMQMKQRTPGSCGRKQQMPVGRQTGLGAVFRKFSTGRNWERDLGNRPESTIRDLFLSCGA